MGRGDPTRGRGNDPHRDGSLADLNERLREEFEEFRINRMQDGTIGVLPVLLSRPVEEFNVAGAYGAWEAAGMPEPTAEQVEAYEAASRETAIEAEREAPIWAETRPPAKPLRIPAKLRDSQGCRPFSSGLALPPLVVGISGG